MKKQRRLENLRQAQNAIMKRALVTPITSPEFIPLEKSWANVTNRIRRIGG